jgi:hypothetical protein
MALNVRVYVSGAECDVVWLNAELMKTLPSPSGNNADPQGESGIHSLYLKME